ncbi:MAG TPA: MBL fold metallo-hydrolase [candidate division Zixibacteria bacterium]|nr:MBL fold metallo-hydrolase [candidate division Zixibacteria bacterium]
MNRCAHRRARARRLSRLALLACHLWVACAPAVFAARVTPAEKVHESIVIREEASADSLEIGRLRKGETAPLLESVPYWYKIQLANGEAGYVAKAWSRLLEDGTGAQPAGFKIHFLDVGTGDAVIVDMGDKEIVIDGGDSLTVLHDYARKEGIIEDPIELVVVTHGDSDHWKGLVRLLNQDGKATAPRTLVEFWEPGYTRDCNPLASYDTFITRVSSQVTGTFKRPLENFHAPSTRSRQVAPFTLPLLPGMIFTLLHSSATPPASNNDCPYRINNASIVFKLEIQGVKVLFTGDANGKERNEQSPGTPGHIEKMLLDLEQQHPGLLKADILKVPHHGSETASTQAFIDAVDPRFVIISASTKHHLPKLTTILRYENGERAILQTDKNQDGNKDHIVCAGGATLPLVCNYKSVLEH